MWCWRRIERIKRRDKVSDEDMLRRVDEERSILIFRRRSITFINDLKQGRYWSLKEEANDRRRCRQIMKIKSNDLRQAEHLIITTIVKIKQRDFHDRHHY